jgi:nicotinate-nucleotide--dimethylbenzimidazole phosphoribosyltransferase
LPTREEHDVLSAIARRLDGLPLALELAAAWMDVLSPASVLERLEHRFELLHSDEPDRPSRHASMEAALDRVGDRVDDPVDCLAALGSADLAASAGFMAEAARRGVPVLLDGLISVACALMAERLAPGAAAWFAAGHRSTEPAQAFALEKLGLEPILDVSMRLGEGSGAVAAVPLVRSSVALLRDVALLADILPG